MFDEQDRQYFYNEFKSNGYEVGSYDDFKKDLNNKEDRDWYYNEAKNMGYDVGTQADFDKMVLEPAASASPSTGGKQVVASAHASKPQVAQPVAKPKTEYPQEVLDAYNSPDNKPGNFKDLAQLNDEYQRGELKKPGIISQALGMFSNVDAGNVGKEQKVGGMIANMLLGDNMQQPQQAQQPQDNNQQVQQTAQQEASPESKEKVPVTASAAVVNNEGLMDAKLANYLENWKQRPDKQGTYFENMVADLLADGTANSNEEAVQMVQSALGRYANRSAMDVTNQVVASLPDDTVQDAEQSIEAQWYSHGVQDKLKQEADSMGISYDDYVGQFLKPAMVQSLVNKYGPNYRDIAEGIATRLYAHDEHVQDRLMNQDINEALSDVISKYVSPSVVDEYNKAQEAGSKAFTEGMEGSQFIPANLRLGTALGAQYEANEAKDPAKVLSGLQKKFGKLYRNPEFLNDMSNAAFKVMQRYGLNGTQSSDPKQFKPMINSVLKNELDQLEIKGMMPKGSAEYIMKTGLGNTIVGKITRKAIQTDYQNWLEDMANQQYQPGFWENVASGALTFAGDAWSYWLPGAAGGKLTKSMIAKAEGKLAGDLMAKGMERKVAERAAKVLIGKSKDVALKNGAVHGAVTFGGQSAISKPIDEVYRTGQFDENGKIYNPSVGKIIANTLGEVTKQTAVGAIMQGGTIANMIGKGRGLATNILADVGGKVVDSGIMTGQQLLERMAQDPNFKPTGKDAAESFLESMANLTAIGLPGMMGKYARFKDAREFNKKFDFTDQDIAELKRFGYDGLRDAFEKVGIGEYAVEGENAQRLDGQLTQKYMDLMNDKSVPEVLKAKMMAVVEGKRPSSFSPVIDSEVYRGDDGKYYLETYNKDGGVIDRKEYSSHDAARNDEKKMEYEKTLGLASVLEGEFHNEFTQEHLDGLYNKAAQKYNMGEKLTDEDKAAVYLHQNAGAIKDIMDKQQKGIILTEEEQKQVDAYRHYYDSALENSSVMREFVNTFEDSHGVARGTLRKALESKDKKYAPLVESYLKELYNSIELKREMKQTVDDLYNTAHGNEQKRIEQSGVEGEKPAAPVEVAAPVDGSAGGEESAAEVPPTEPPTPPVEGETASNESKPDAYVMGQNAYQNGDAEVLKAIDHNDDVSKARLKRAFADDEAQMNVVVKAYEDGKDMEQFVAQRANSLTPAQQDAVRKYVEAQDAKNGVYDALQHADDGYGEALKEQLWPYQTEDGNIVPATLTTGQQVFLKKANEYGGGFVVVPDEQGQPTIKQVSSADIKEVGTPVPMDDYINQQFAEQVDARYKQFRSQFDGSGLKPSDTVEVAMESGDEPMQMTFAGYSEDGKIVLSDGKDNIALTKDEFNAWRQNALDASIGAELDAEDAQRANDDAAKAEAEKKQRYNDGIVGLGMGQPDYSSKDTEPNVAAEYLQEQFGEDHGKLLNLVNGSRDDIKTQLANKKKAAAEYQNWLDTNADLDQEKAQKVENDLALVNEQIADLDARFKNWNAIRNSVMTPDEVKAMKEERKAEVEKAGVDETAIVPSDDFHLLVLDDKELKKQYPTMDEANDYITSQRKDIYHTQEGVEHKMNDVNDMLEQYINGETELDPTQLMELNTTKAQLEALQTNLSVAAKGLKDQANKLSKLYKTEVSQQEMEELGMTPSEQRKVLVADALKKNDLGAIKEIYKDASVDITDLTPQTLEEAVSESLRPHSLNPESLQYELGKSNFKFGIGKGYDSNKFNYLIAKKGTGMSVNDFAVKVYNDLPVNLQDMGYTDQDVRNALLDMFKSYDSVKEMKNVALMNRIAAAEDELSSEEEYYEAQKEREIIERQAEIENYKSYINEKELSLPSESELDHINGLEFDRMMEIEDRDREYKQFVKSILPELADYDDRSNEEGYGGGSSLGSDSSRRGVDEGNSQGEEVGNGEASSESEIGEGSDSGRKGRQETGSLEPGEGSAVRGSHLPQEASFGERLKSAIAETETEPTEAQKKAGNYKKGHLSFGGYDYTVETPKGVTRSGKDEQGKPWSVTMHDTYGYILGKIGVDGDHIDMFINDAADLDTFDGNVYVVDQVNPETGEFDEHKVMYGYPSEEAATESYLANYSKGWKGLGKVTSVPKATFDKWLESSDRKTKPFAEYAMVQKEQAKFDRDVKEVKPSEMTEAQKVAYDAVSTMLKKAGIPVKVVSNEDMEKVAEAQDNLNLAMLLNQPEMRFKIKTPEEKQAAENAYNFAKELRPDKWKQYAVVDMSNPNKMPEYFEKQELARKERSYYNKLMWGNYKVFNLDKSFEDNVAGLTGSFPSEFDPYKIDAQTSKKDELKKQIKETEEAYKLTGQERKEYQNQLMKEYMDEHGLASENDIPDDVWREFDYKAVEKYQDKLDSLFAKYKDLDRQLKAVAEPGVRFLRTYHGSQASFDNFDHSFMGSGEGAQAYGWGTYVSEVEGIAKAYAKANAKKNAPSRLMYQGKPMTYKTPSIIYQVALDMDKFNISAKEAISKMIDADEKKLASVGDTPFAKMKAKQVQDELKVLKDLNPSDFKINEDYDTVAQDLIDTKSGLDLLEDELKDAKSYVDLYQSRLDEAKEELSKAKESGTGLGVDMYESDIEYYSEQVKRYKQSIKTKESDIKDVKTKVDALQKKLDSMEKPRNLYSVDIPDDTGRNYIGWDEPLGAAKIMRLPKVFKADGWEYKKVGQYDTYKIDDNEHEVWLEPSLTTGKELYRDLTNALGSDKAASEFLTKAGFVGVKVIAQRNAGGNKDGKMNYVIFDENNAQIVDHTKFAQGKGVVYGYTDGKEIVLNQEHLNANTPIHEYQHLWRTAAKKMNPELIEHGDKLIMQTQLFADLKEDPNYKHLSDDEICDEAFARLTGEDGAAILEQMANDAIKENPLDTAKELTIINRLKNWLKKFWYWTLDTFTKWKPEDIKKMTLEDIRNLVLRDLANGVDPRTKLHEAENADDIKFMGSTTKKRMKNLASQFEGRKLDEAQQAVADVYSGKDNNRDFSFTSGGSERTMVMRQGNDDHAGTKHSVYRHFGVSKNYITIDDILSLPKMLNDSTRKPSKKGTIEYSYTDKDSGVTYTVVTKPVGNKEHFQNFYSDRKVNPSDASHVAEGNTYTPEGARKTDGNAFTAAKVDNNSETAKGNDENLSVEDKIKAVSQQFGVDEADVAMYANAVKKGSTAEAARARANIKRHLMQVNEGNIFSFKDVVKYTKPINEALKENFGDLDAMIEERIKQVEAERNAMEAARKRAEEEEAKRQKHLEELSLIPDDQLDKQYMDALAKGDDATAREMLDEAARRKGYDDTESAYQGVGAWAAPGNPGYESDKARRDDWESSGSDVNLEDMALGYTPQPDDYFSHPERYSQNTPHGLESVKAINTAIDAIKNGEKDVMVKVYRAVPTSVKEGKLRNGDWVTPSKKYAEMHGTNRLEGKYRIIEDEVPANQLWWDGNDANEFGFDDGKAYKYKNAKNNRKLNDLVTFDDEGDVIPPSKRFNSRKQDVRFHRVTEPEELERLNKEKTFRMYSGMQEVDGKLYSPMAAIIDGKRTDATEIGAWMRADERPDLVKNGKFQLVKTDKKPGAGEGPVPAAYNPYMHTSTSVMNDQFSGAYARGNIKVVEWEIPESEKTSGYHAEGAKDSVGLVPWTSGTVNSLLPKDRQRSVMLSRWRKAVRIVPDEEVAEKIAEQLSGTGLAIPWNVVTPNQLRELAKLGVPITTVEQGIQNPEVKEKFLDQMEELKKEFPQAQFVDVKMTKEAFKEWGGKGIVKSPILEQKLQKHPDSLMKAGTYFSGGGLVEEGLKGIIDPVVAVEYDRKISGVYRNNFGQHIVTADVRDVDPKELVKHIDGEVEYFHASPVCKNYSQAKSNGGEVELDKETAKSTADFINAVKPRVVTIENVKGYKDSEAMKIITQALDKNGYKWDADVYNAADFGGYTSRERLIVRAVKEGELPEKPKKQPRKGGWLEAVEDILPTLTEKINGVAPWMDTRLKADGIDWQKVEKPLYVMGSAYADGKIPHAYGDEILPTLRTKSGDVIIMPGGKVLRADGRVLARITGLGDDYLLPKTESLAHTIIGNGIPVQLTKGVIAPLLNKDDLSGRNVLARLGSSIFKNNWDADKQKQVSDRVVNTANKLGGAEATVYTSVDEVPDAYLSDVKNGATGWYDPTTHTVHVYLPNCADANEAERTVLHEKIGHEGMEVLLGGENEVRKFANFVYRSASKDVRGKIIDFANKYDPDWKNNDRINVGTQEYIAHLAEEGPKTAEDFSLWTKIKHYLIKVLKKLGVRVPGLLNDKDLRYYLMKAGKALHVWDEMPREKQEAMMKQASNAEIKDALSDGAGKGKPRQKKGESAIQYMKRVMEWKRWKEAREDENDPEPPMFYDFDKDAEGKKEWERLNKEWRDIHHLQGDEMPIKPERKEGETDEAFFSRYKEWEKWNDAMADKENPMPDMFSFEKAKQDEARQKYEDWLTRHELNEQNDADLDLYEGKIYPAETNPEADALEQRVMQDLAEVTSTDVSKEGAAKTVKHAVIHRRKNMEEASADDAIYINDVKNRIEKMADSGAFDKLLSDYKGKPNKAEKLAEAIPYIIEAPRRLRDLAHDLNATGAFDKGHIHIQPDDVEAIQPFVADLIAETGKKHTVLKDDKEVEVYDDPQAVSDVASKMAQAINANHQGEEGFVPIDGTDILSEHVLPLVKQQIVPEGIDYKNLSPEMKAAIDSIRDWYNYTYDWLKDNRTLREDTGYSADYVNHIWDKEKSDKQAYAMYVENRQRTKSPNEKPRTISTLMEGISVGLVPKTTDITKMMAYYSRSNIEAWVNKTMLQELSGLNVIERNEDGEIISSDPLLSSTPPFNLEQYQYFEIPGVGPVWVYNVSPKQVKVKNPITGKERVLYSEASAGDRFGVVFETYQSSPFWKAFDTLASSAKKLELGFSGFHAGALTEVYMVQNMVEFGPKKAMANFMKYIFADTMKNHELPCFANPEDFQEAATHLVKFGATNDYAAADVQNMFDNMRDAMMKVQEKLKDGNGISGTVALATMPLKVVTQLLSLINKGMDRALWDFLHDGLKLATYRMRADKTKERAKKKGWTEEELSRALDEDGQFVNDMFGGQHWDVLGASHRTLRYAGRVLLSPDWNASTTRHFLALTGYGSIWNEATFENFKHYYKRLGHGILTPEDEGRRSRQISALLCYGIGFMVFYEAIANGINAAFRAMDEEKERKKAEEIRKTNPGYRSPYELAYPDGMKWYDYLMRGNSLGQQSKIYLGRYADGTEMYIRHGKQFREVPEYLFNHKGELEFPGPMVQRMIGKANPMVRMTLDDINYLSDFQASHADQEIQRKYGKTIGLLYKDALYWAPFLIPSQENKEFKAVDFFFPSSKGFSPWKAQSYFKDFILSGDMEGVVMTYQSCQRNGIDPEAQIKAAIGSVKALESAEMQDGVTSLQEASKRFDAAKSITEKKKMRQKMKKFLSQSEYKAFTQKEALDMVQGYLNGDEDLKEMEKAESKYLMKAKAEDVTEDWRIQNVWNGTMETYQEYQRLKDVDKAKANAFKNSKTNKRLFAARKAISAAKKKMNKAKKQMDGQNDAAKLVEIRKTRKELLETLNGME
jgi:site-specific DNA-cytosine methylase